MKTATTSPRASTAERAEQKHAAPLKLYVVLSRAVAAVNRLAEESLADQDITATEFGILEALYHKGPLLHGEIQKKILVTSGGITYLVDRLVSKGLVQREECTNDRRARYAVLTEAGRALMDELFPRHAARLAQALGGLSEREQLEATRLLKKLGISAASLGN